VFCEAVGTSVFVGGVDKLEVKVEDGVQQRTRVFEFEPYCVHGPERVTCGCVQVTGKPSVTPHPYL
jgi:hypothetical protein